MSGCGCDSESVSWSTFQGDAFSVTLLLKDSSGAAIDLTGKTIEAQLRVSVGDPVLVETFNVEYLTPLTDGRARLYFSEAETDAIDPGCYVFDVKLSPNRRTLFSGTFDVKQSITI